MAGEQVFPPSGVPVSGRITPAVFPFYTTGEDNLRIVSFNSAASVKLRLVARLLGANGRPLPAGWDHTPHTDRSTASDDFPLSGQTLLNLTVLVTAGSPQQGQCFVLVQLIRGIGGAAIVLGNILAADVTVAQGPSFPGSPIESAADSGGFIRSIQGTTPGAGNPISETVPTGARWELRSLAYTDVRAGVANPCHLYFEDAAGNFIGGAVAPFNHPGGGVSLSVMYTAGWPQPYQNINALTTPMFGGLPYPMVLLAGQKFIVPNFSTSVMLNVFYTVRETLDV